MSYIAIQRKIAKGKGLFVFSIVFAVLVRILYYYLSNDNYQAKQFPDAGYLWQLIAPLFSEHIYSVLAATVSVALLALLCNYLDVRNVILREKSSLAPAFIILLFSSHVTFFEMSPYYVAVLLMLWAINELFAAYHSDVRAIPTANISAVIALGSLFEPILVLYFVLFIVGFSMMHILDIKSLISALLGFAFVLVPAYFISVTTNTEALFLSAFEGLNINTLLQIPVLTFGYFELVLALIAVFVFGWLCIHNYMTSYKDKIRTRVFISFLGIVQLFTVLGLYLLNYNYFMNIYIGIAIGSILLAHYFTVTVQRIMIFVFWLILTICLLVSYISFVE